MTELIFADRSGFEAWMAELASLKSEHEFLDRTRTQAYVIDEWVTSE
jgi:hypothetical protein